MSNLTFKPTTQQLDFVNRLWKYAVNTSRKYGTNPIHQLAHAVAENGWAGALLSKNYNNYFNITVGSTWKGQGVRLASGLVFRVYDSPQGSFDDHAELLLNPKSAYYQRVAQVIRSNGTLEQYAQAISQSGYITEANGDNRSLYYQNIVSSGQKIAQLPKPFVWDNRFLLLGVVATGVGAGYVHYQNPKYFPEKYKTLKRKVQQWK